MAGDDGMDDLAGDAAKDVNQALADQEASLILKSSAKLAALRPQVSDQAAYDKLIAAVAEATQQNESVAAFKDRITNLGIAVVKIAKEVSALPGLS